MKPLGNLRTHDCADCQALCCVASGRKSLPDKLSLSTSHPCPNIARVGDCVSCSVHDTLSRDPSMFTCHFFDCRGLGNRFSDMMKKSWVHWMKDAPLTPKKQVVFDNVVYYFDLISTALSFLSLLWEVGLGSMYQAGMQTIENLMQSIDEDCQQGISSKPRLVDFWIEIMALVEKAPKNLPHNSNTIYNTQSMNDAIAQNIMIQLDRMQPGLSTQLAPVLREYAFAYSTITLVECATHCNKFDRSFHDRAVEQVLLEVNQKEKIILWQILDALYRPLNLWFQN